MAFVRISFSLTNLTVICISYYIFMTWSILIFLICILYCNNFTCLIIAFFSKNTKNIFCFLGSLKDKFSTISIKSAHRSISLKDDNFAIPYLPSGDTQGHNSLNPYYNKRKRKHDVTSEQSQSNALNPRIRDVKMFNKTVCSYVKLSYSNNCYEGIIAISNNQTHNR